MENKITNNNNAEKQSLLSVALGGLTSNPVFVLTLGMCPTLAKTNSLENALWLGLSTMAVLIISTVLLSALAPLIPGKVRIPAYIMIIATLVTVVDLLVKKFMPSVYKEIGEFILLIAVNCIILGRIETFSVKNKPHMALLDGASMGAGFLVALVLLGALRELLGKGALYGKVLFTGFTIPVMTEAVGGFIMLAILMGIFNAVYAAIEKKNKEKKRLELIEAAKEAKAKKAVKA